jgi:ATP-dependent RNA helicase DeaD
MGQFREKSLQLLIATDVAARGIDVQGITHVVNYELPDDMEVYTHRSGRTGRAGNSGICISIVHSREAFKLKQLEKMINATITRMDIPTGKDVCRKQFFFFMDKLLQADISHGDYETYVPMLEEKFAEVTKEEVLKRVAALEFDRFLKYYENSEDLNVREERRVRKEFTDGASRDQGRRRDTSGREFSGNGDFMRVFVNLGTKDGFYKASFLQFILDMSDLKKEVLGRIDMKDMNSWIEIDRSVANKMIKAIDGKTYKGRRIRMNDANSRG